MAGVLGRNQRNSWWCIMNFQDWFALATKNIAKSELPQLRNELEAHVVDAINVHQQTGITTLEAEQKAMLELGDPKIAARGFARTYLTAEEARRVGLETGSFPKWVKWAGAIFLIATMFVFIMFPVWTSSTYPTLTMAFTAFCRMELAGVATMLLGAWLEQRMFARRAPIRVLTGVTLFGQMLILVFLANWYTMPYPFQLPAWLTVGFGVLSMIGWYFTDLQLLQKLQTRA
jgi:hypothetical protein